MYRYVLPSEQGAWVPIRSEDLEARIKELDAKKVTILEVSELVEDGRDRKSYSYRGPLYFDIDCKGDLALAIESGRKLADKLIDLGVPQQGVRIYASGSKGIHITVDQKYFSSGRPIKGLPLVYKAMAKELYVPGLDFAVYSCGRGNAFRVVNVQRDDGKYRVPLMYDELSTLSVEQYRELTAVPRNVAIIEPAPVKATLLALMFDEARKEVNTLAPPTVIVSSKEGVEELAREVPPCVQRLVDWKGIRPERNLNQVAMQLGIYLARSKVSDVIADGLISRLVDNSKSSKYDSLRAKQEHIMGQIGFMATAEDYHFSCPSMRSMLEKPPCHGCPLENSPESGSSASAMQGLVERDDGMYVISSRTEKMLTNFSMLPTDHYIEIPRDGATGRRVGTRMELYEKEELVATVMFQESSWLSRSAFMRDTTEGHGVLMFFGTDNDVQKIKGHVLNKEQTMGEIYRVHTCGTHLEFIGKTEILTYVEPDMSINSNRIQGTHELAGEVVARPYFSHTNICAAADADADDALANLLNINQPIDIGLITGWFAACHLKAHVMALYSQFPVLSIWGSAGAGKSVTVSLISWLNGTDYMMRDTPVNVSNITPYAILDYCSSTTTVPRVLEEYNKSKMRANNWKAVGEMLKASWNGETVLRGVLSDSKKDTGRTGAKVSKIPITSPLVVVSEQELEMPALQERSIRVKLSKEKRKGRGQELREASRLRSKLREIGKAMMARSLQLTLEQVREIFERTESMISYELDDRPRYSYQISLLGLLFLQQVVKNDLKLEKSVKEIETVITALTDFFQHLGDAAKEFNARSEIDAVLEDMNVMVGLSNGTDTQWLGKGIHYLVIDEGATLLIDPMLCHALYKKYVRSSSHQPVVIESAKQFSTLICDEPYYAGMRAVAGMAGGRPMVRLDRAKMAAKGVDSSNFD